MDDKLNKLLDEAVEARGDKYRGIRSQIIAYGDDAITALKGKSADPDWKADLQAAIFLQRLKDPERAEYIRRVAEGTDESLEPQKYMTGKPTPDIAAAKILENDSEVAPILFEMVYKESDITTDYAFTVIIEVLTEWQDPHTVPVFRDIFLNKDEATAFRRLSTIPLVKLKTADLYDDLSAVYTDADNPVDLRALALVLMSSTDDERAFPFLKDKLLDNELDFKLRKAAASGLGKTRDEQALPILKNQYNQATTFEMKQAIISGIAEVKTPNAVMLIEQLREGEEDGKLRGLMDRKLRSLKSLVKD